MSHLRLVGTEAPPKRRKGTRPSPVLTEDQERAFKAAVRGLASKRFGSLVKMSLAIGYTRRALSNMLSARGRVTGDLVLRVALACSIPVEVLITPGPREAVAS